jgi:hypothetical protein
MQRAMPNWESWVLGAAVLLGAWLPWSGAPASAAPAAGAQSQSVAQARPQIVIHPRREPGPNAKRYCRSWLAKEYRVSGPVIVPEMRCWWQ